MAANDITGDNLFSKVLSPEGEKNFEKIFGKKKINGGWIPPAPDDVSTQDDKPKQNESEKL